MTLGEKLKQARLDAGLSQRQLCAGEITRNMLSQIENGSAKPSMDTLKYLAQRLEKPISYFLEDTAVTSPNQETMQRARTAFSEGKSEETLEILGNFREPDPVFREEKGLITKLACLQSIQKALRQRRVPYARQLLGDAEKENTIYDEFLQHEIDLLRAWAYPEQTAGLAEKLNCDRFLLVKARAALEKRDAARCLELLGAAECKSDPRYNLLRGEAYYALGEYALGISCYHKAEEAFPEQAYPKLEEGYRETGDFKRAYEYACKQR